MSEIAPADSSRFEQRALRNRLKEIDRDPDQLQAFIKDTYIGHPDYPHFLYQAAIHLTALQHLDLRGPTREATELTLPDPDQAMLAFHAYTQLIAMNRRECASPNCADNETLVQRLRGSREELAFHAIFAYARGQGADFVALPTPTRQDLDGGANSSDIQLFMPPLSSPSVELQITRHSVAQNPRDYNPETVVIGLEDCLGHERAIQAHGVLHQVGLLDEIPETVMQIGSREHSIILDAAADILTTARHWLHDVYEPVSA